MKTNIQSLLDEELISITGGLGFNSAHITQSGGGTNFISATQIGTDNSLITDQKGQNNTTRLRLKGSGVAKVTMNAPGTLDTTVNGTHTHTTGVDGYAIAY